MILQKLLYSWFNNKIDGDWRKSKIPKELLTQYEEIKPELEKCYSQATHWHGTGRYHYSILGKSKYESVDTNNIIDTLPLIIREGGLKPHFDPWVKVNGTYSESVSTTQWRMYARTYVELHMYGSNRIFPVFGKREDIIYFFLIYSLFSSPLVALLKSSLKAFDKKQFANKGTIWSKTINNTLESKGNSYSDLVYILGKCTSNIKNNYGILIGINGKGLSESHINPIINLFETRFSEKITFDRITHFEVPLANLEETKNILRKHHLTIPVFALELCEIYYSTLPIKFYFNSAKLPHFDNQELTNHYKIN